MNGIVLYLGEPNNLEELNFMINKNIFPTHFSFSIPEGLLDGYYVEETDGNYILNQSFSVDISAVLEPSNLDNIEKIVSNEYGRSDQRYLVKIDGSKISLSDLIKQTISKSVKKPKEL